MKQKRATSISRVKDMSVWKKWSIKWFVTAILFIIVSILLLVSIAERTGFELDDWPSIMILIEVMVGAVIYAGIASRKIDASEKMKRQAIWACSIFVLVLAGLLILHIIDLIRVGEIIEIIVLFGLVLITAEYAMHTRKMAKEMLNQRYDTFRPVIDIEQQAGGSEFIGEAFAAECEDYLHGLKCILRNIGIGPAVDVFSKIKFNGNEGLCPFGTIAKGASTQKNKLSIERTDDRMALLAYYRDIYGRCFESKRELTVDKEKSSWKLGTLDARKIDKKYI